MCKFDAGIVFVQCSGNLLSSLTAFRSGQIIIMDDPDDPSIQLTYDFLKTEYKIENCKCSYCSLRKTNPQSLPDPWMETNDPDYFKIRSILTGEITKFFQTPDSERESDVSAAIAYLRKYDAVNRELVVVQMYLQNYWMITTQQCGTNELE